MKKSFKGKAWVFADNISNDTAVRFSEENKYISDPALLAKYCMTGYDPDFPNKVQPGAILVAGKNFGCGHVHDQFPRSIKGIDIEVVVAESFSRDFYRTIINLGYPIPIICKDANSLIKNGDEIEIDIAEGTIKIIASDTVIKTDPLSQILLSRIEAGGTNEYLKKLFSRFNLNTRG